MSSSRPDTTPPFRKEMPTIVEGPPSLLPGRRAPQKKRGVVAVLKGPQRGMFIPIEDGGATFGRSDEASCVLPDPGLSRVHARIYAAPNGTYFIEDTGSTNGTYLDQVRVESPTALHDGALIGLGRRTVLKFAMQDPLEEQVLIDVYESATRDRLTGAFNRGVFDERLASEFAFARRHKKPLALILFDVDHFKRVNDTYGHPTGDSVLVGIADAVEATVRVEDLFARYGGEEFAIVARESGEANACVLAERVRQAIGQVRFSVGSGELRVTVSLGVACACEAFLPESPEKLVGAADSALYAAKATGRDRVVVFSPSKASPP